MMRTPMGKIVFFETKICLLVPNVLPKESLSLVHTFKTVTDVRSLTLQTFSDWADDISVSTSQ